MPPNSTPGWPWRTGASRKAGANKLAALAGAEKTFREDLDRNPRNPRSLFGLHQALMQQKQDYDTGFIQKQFDASWKGGNGALKLEDLV
jgi:hypothetical protein